VDEGQLNTYLEKLLPLFPCTYYQFGYFCHFGLWFVLAHFAFLLIAPFEIASVA